MSDLSAARCETFYLDLTKRTSTRGEPYSVDTHRNTLGVAKRFLKGCVKQGWLSSNPLTAVEGIGKRRRGKEQLRAPKQCKARVNARR